MPTKTIFDLSKKYIKQAGDTTKDWYQIRSLAIISLQYSMIGALMVILPFLEQDPVFKCKNDAGVWEKCDSISDACKQVPITVDEDASAPTITLEFKLYCDDAWKKGLLGTSLFISATITTLLMGIVANNYGRKIACIISLTSGSLGAIGIGFSVNYWMALALYGVAGFAYPYLDFCSILLNEMGNEHFRVLGMGSI